MINSSKITAIDKNEALQIGQERCKKIDPLESYSTRELAEHLVKFLTWIDHENESQVAVEVVDKMSKINYWCQKGIISPTERKGKRGDFYFSYDQIVKATTAGYYNLRRVYYLTQSRAPFHLGPMSLPKK